MAQKKEAAYVLPEDASTSSEPQHFGAVFPGLHTPGVATAVSDIGDASFDADAAAKAVKEHGLPLEKTSAAPGDAPSGASAPSEPAQIRPEEGDG